MFIRIIFQNLIEEHFNNNFEIHVKLNFFKINLTNKSNEAKKCLS